MNSIINGYYCQEDKKYGIDGQIFEIPFEKPFDKGDIITNNNQNCKPLFVESVQTYDHINHCYVHNVSIASNNAGDFYERKWLIPGTRYNKMPLANDLKTDGLHKQHEMTGPHLLSMVDVMKPHQILFNRRMAGEKLTDEENAILDAGFPVQQAYNEFVKALNEVSKYFHPNVEDVYEGYECEKAIMGEFDRHICFPNREVYTKYTLSSEKSYEPYILTKQDVAALNVFTGDLRSSPGLPVVGFFRTPFITREKIAAEGWSIERPDMDVSLIWGTEWICSKQLDAQNELKLIVNFDRTIRLYKTFTNKKNEPLTFTLFDGECKDINTFRKICKLVKV